MTNSDLDDLLEYLGQEQACYTSLLDLSRQQKEVITDGEVDDLLQTLSQKQKVLARIGEIETKLLPFKQNWGDVRASLDDDDRQVLDLALGTVEELLAELIALEKESEQLLVERRDRCQAELTETTHGARVTDAYAPRRTPPSARFLDIRSE